ncbi:MAG: CBS domain-containing protein [Candidatus Kapabacteria bacterium]|nr:CBS domain-containing protein [Ignavibacteriota bacterium]MCW5884740.1 CBS domain-containing protein [Candidatus Kapabacteria bacterium]
MPNKAKVSEIMTTNVFTVSIDDTVRDAELIMKNEKVRHIPVLEGTKIVGMICDDRIREYSLRKIYDSDQNFGEEAFNKITDFEKIMNEVTHVIYPEDSVAKAVKIFAKHKVNCLPVVDWEMNLVGLITNTDLLLYFHQFLEELESVP